MIFQVIHIKVDGVRILTTSTIEKGTHPAAKTEWGTSAIFVLKSDVMTATPTITFWAPPTHVAKPCFQKLDKMRTVAQIWKRFCLLNNTMVFVWPYSTLCLQIITTDHKKYGVLAWWRHLLIKPTEKPQEWHICRDGTVEVGIYRDGKLEGWTFF